MENEIWKDVPGYAGTYQVSNFGRVKSLRKVLKAGLRKGYLPEIDHIDGNPLNNNANNLKWVTRQQNELNPRSIKVYQYSRDNVFIKSYPNAQIASKETHIPQSNINRCVNNKLKSAGGYLWKKI